ncbi:hypothetical protein N2152v2_010496 [Parachlorella kessleri]
MCNSTDVAAAVLAQFEALAKTGKPQPHEHTVLAGIALTLPPQETQLRPAALQPGGQGMPTATVSLQVAAAGADSTHISPAPPQQQPVPATPIVVALATGTKCLPASKRDPSGRALNDCHAEVCCRRALLRWLYCEMLETVRLYCRGVRDGTAVLQLQRREQEQQQRQQRWSVGTEAEAAGGAAAGAEPEAQEGAIADSGAVRFQGKLPTLPGWHFALRPGVQLHMFVSQPPCGDASIYEGGGFASHNSCASADAVVGSSAGQRDPSAQEPCQQLPIEQQAVAEGMTSAQPRLQLGRTGAKPIKRAKVSQPEKLPSNPSGLLAAWSQKGGASQQQLLPPGSAETAEAAAAGTAHSASPAAAANRAWAVPQAYDVESYGEAQPVGGVRRKPGRGEATLSLSCSDKLARWRLLGLQGSLLSGLLSGPLHLSSVTVAISTPSSAGRGCDKSSGSPPVAEAAVEALSHTAVGPAASAAEAAVEAALRRALVERTQPLEDLSEQPGSSDNSGAAEAVLSWERLLQLGLAPGGPRRVAGGSTLLWHAPPSTQFLAKGGLKAVGGGVQRQTKGQQQQQQQQQQKQVGQGCSEGCKATPGTLAPASQRHAAGSSEPTLYTVKGSTQQAVAGATGLKLGVSRMGAARPPPAAAPCVCKEALARLFLEVARELESLSQGVAGDSAVGLSPACSGATAAGRPATPTVGALAARAERAEPAVLALEGGGVRRQHWEGSSYRELKHQAGAEYQQSWRSVLAAPGSVFEAWLPKLAGLEGFIVDSR